MVIYLRMKLNTTAGLVILDALYGPSEQDEEAQGLVLDVTTAVQALVNNSQLYIAGHRTKVELDLFRNNLISLTTAW